MKRKSAYRVHYCMSPMGCRFQMLLGYTFVFGDIGLRRKKPKNFFFLNLGFSSPVYTTILTETCLCHSFTKTYQVQQYTVTDTDVQRITYSLSSIQPRLMYCIR